MLECPFMMSSVVGSIHHDGPIDLFLVSTTAFSKRLKRTKIAFLDLNLVYRNHALMTPTRECSP